MWVLKSVGPGSISETPWPKSLLIQEYTLD